MKTRLRLSLDPKTSAWGKWFLLATIVGIVAGVAGIAFQLGTELVHHYTLAEVAGYHANEATGESSFFGHSSSPFQVWLILPIICLGGLLTGCLVYFFAPEAEGHGTDAAIGAFHNERGKISWRTPIVKAIASAITLGTGGSAGREGPIAQIGAGFGSYLAQRLKLSVHDRRIMLAIGMGAGIGAIFRAPLAGAIFAGEILYRDADIEAEVIVPGAVASTVAYSIFQLALPPDLRFTPLFGDNLSYEFAHLGELIPYTLLVFALVAASAIYVTTLEVTHSFFARLKIVPHVKPLIGAAMAGLVAIGLFYSFGRDLNALAVLGSGYGFLQLALDNAGSLSLTILFAVAATKILTTALTIGSGGSGGVFGPSMVIGGSVGAGVGKLFHQWMPTVVTQPSAFTIVGMAGFFAGCANAPFSTILMVTEMTGNYKLLVPTLWVSSLSFILARKWSLYSTQVDTRMESPAHRGDYNLDLLEGLRVEDAYRKSTKGITFHEDASLDQIVHSLADSMQRYFPVFNSNEKLVGIFSAEDVRRFLYDDLLWAVANAGDVMQENVITLQLDDDLNHAIGQFTALNVDELPVVDADDPNKIIGFLRRKETIAAYNVRRVARQRENEEENRA
jgi:CIC family chloride channel protein